MATVEDKTRTTANARQDAENYSEDEVEEITEESQQPPEARTSETRPEAEANDFPEEKKLAVRDEAEKPKTPNLVETDQAAPAAQEQEARGDPSSKSKECSNSKPPAATVSPRHRAHEKCDLPLLSLPATNRMAVVEEHEAHRERLEAIASGRCVSQTSLLSKASHAASSRSVGSRNRNPVDPVTMTMMENHKKALEKIKAKGARIPIVHVVHWPRLGNTHAPKGEFEAAPADNSTHLSAREQRLQHNSYRNERLMAADRMDAENAKFVAALISAKPIITPTSSLLEQERQRQELVRRIERGPSPRGGASPRADAVDFIKRETQWDNHVNPHLPRPPFVGSVIVSREISKPKVQWEDKVAQAREIERRREQQHPENASKNEESAKGSEATISPRESQLPKQSSSQQDAPALKPKPPAVPLTQALERVPPVTSGRHVGQPQQSKKDVKSRVDSMRREPAPKTHETQEPADAVNRSSPDVVVVESKKAQSDESDAKKVPESSNDGNIRTASDNGNNNNAEGDVVPPASVDALDEDDEACDSKSKDHVNQPRTQATSEENEIADESAS